MEINRILSKMNGYIVKVESSEGDHKGRVYPREGAVLERVTLMAAIVFSKRLGRWGD
jgi:hypothetical protein